MKTVKQLLKKAISAERSGDLATARHLYTIANALDPGRPDIEFGLAMVDFSSGNVTKARSTFLRLEAQQAAPEWASSASIMLGNIASAQSGYELAIRHYHKALSHASSLTSGPTAIRLRSKAIAGIGHCLYSTGNPGEAKGWFLQALALIPQDIDIQANIAICDSDLGNVDEAIVSLLTILNSFPERGDLWHNLAEIYAENGRVVEAMYAYTKGASLGVERPNSGAAAFAKDPARWRQLGLKLADAGEFKIAEFCLERAKSIEETNVKNSTSSP